MTSDRPALGAGLMAVATLGFAGMATLVKLMDTALPEQQLVFWRAAFSLPLLVVLVLRKRRSFVVAARGTILLRSLLGFGAMMLFFYAVGRLTLAEAQILIRLQPVWVALLAPFVVGERPGPRVWWCLALSVVGVGLVLGPSLTTGVVSAAGLAALSSSLLSAGAHLQLRRLGRTDDPDVVVLNFTFLLLLFSGVLSAPAAQLPATGHWPLLVGLALCAMMGQLFMSSAYSVARAPTVATVGYVALPTAALLDWLVFDTVPTGWAMAGGLLIIASGVALAYDRGRTAEEPR
jgi:drug/metabolite transporter (DMT)-like permease